MDLLAHIGNIPVEEWLPFLVPVVVLVVYGRHQSRKRRQALRALPDADKSLDEDTITLVVEHWCKAEHGAVAPAYLPLLYPPGPDGMSARELAERTHADLRAVEHQLEELAELGYVELDERDGFEGRRAWLTFKGYDLLDTTEVALLAAMQRRSERAPSTSRS